MRLQWRSLVLLLFSLISSSCSGPLKSLFLGKSAIESGTFLWQDSKNSDAGQLMPYLMLHFKEDSNQPKELKPLLILFPGTGEDPEDVLGKWTFSAEEAQTMICIPERSSDHNFQEYKTIDSLIQSVRQHYPVKDSRIAIAGISSGALIARNLVREKPGAWTHLVLIASPPAEEWMGSVQVEKLPPILFVHGKKDEQFAYDRMLRNAQELQKRGARVTVMDSDDAGHEWREDWLPRIFQWLKYPEVKPKNLPG